jgi:hypothetical protein
VSLFGRIRSFFSGGSRKVNPDEIARDEAHTVIAEEFGEEDELIAIWEDTIEENIDSGEHLREFTLDQHGADLFRMGWVDEGENADERQAARDEFFELMEAYDISRDEFDWDAWRDWYEDA